MPGEHKSPPEGARLRRLAATIGLILLLAITFTGSASDAEGGDLTAGLSWVSSLDVAIGTGGSFSRSDLSVGGHTITATVTDSGGLAASEQITLTVLVVALSFNPSGDAMVNKKNAASTYGASTLLELRTQNKKVLQTCLKFNITGVNGTVKSAKIRLYVNKGSSSGGSVYLVSNYYLDSTIPWTEDGLIWENAPALNGTSLSTVGAVLVPSPAPSALAPARAANR